MTSAIIPEGKKNIHGVYELGIDPNIASILLLLSMLSEKKVLLVGHVNSLLLDKVRELAIFVGVIVDVLEDAYEISTSDIITHAVPNKMELPLDLKWLASMVILAKTGKGGIEHNSLNGKKLSELKAYVQHITDLGVLVEDDGQYFVFKRPKELSKTGYDLSGLKPIEVISIMALLSMWGSSDITLINVPWSLCSVYARDFLVKLGVKIEEVDDVTTISEREFQEIEYSLPTNLAEGVLIASIVGANGGDVTIKPANREEWAPILSVFNKIGLEFNLVDKELRVWHDRSEPLDVTDLKTSRYPGLLYEVMLPLIVMQAMQMKKFTVMQEAWPGGIAYIEDLKKLGIELIVNESNQHDENKQLYPIQMDVFGMTGIEISSYDLADCEAPIICIAWALMREESLEVKNYDRFMSRFPAFEEKLRAVGVDIKVTEV